MGRNAGGAVQRKSNTTNSFADSADSNSNPANRNPDTANVEPEHNDSQHNEPEFDEPKHPDAFDDFSVADAQHHDKPERDNDDDTQRDQPGQHDHHEPDHEQPDDRNDEHYAGQHHDAERHNSHWAAVHANNSGDDDFECYFLDNIAFVWNEHNTPAVHNFPVDHFPVNDASATTAVASGFETHVPTYRDVGLFPALLPHTPLNP